MQSKLLGSSSPGVTRGRMPRPAALLTLPKLSLRSAQLRPGGSGRLWPLPLFPRACLCGEGTQMGPRAGVWGTDVSVLAARPQGVTPRGPGPCCGHQAAAPRSCPCSVEQHSCLGDHGHQDGQSLTGSLRNQPWDPRVRTLVLPHSWGGRKLVGTQGGHRSSLEVQAQPAQVGSAARPHLKK